MKTMRTFGKLAVASMLLATMLGSRSLAEYPRYLFGLPRPLDVVNSPDMWDGAPSLTPDGLELYFTRGDYSTDPSCASCDIYVARRVSIDADFGEPVLVSSLSSGRAERYTSFSADGLTVYFTPSDGGVSAATRPSLQAPFGSTFPVLEPNDIWNGSAPSISADGLSLYLQYRVAGAETFDVYVARRESIDQPFGEPTSVAELTSPARWQSRPMISADDTTLFFFETNQFQPSNPFSRDASEGELLMLVRATPSDAWSSSFNLGSAINTVNHEDFAHFAANTQEFYFQRSPVGDSSSNGTDIWVSPVLPFDTVAMKGEGGQLFEGFEALGTNTAQAGVLLPTGWTFTSNDVVFNNATTGDFPSASKAYARVYNAGSDGAADRALATDVRTGEAGELDLRALVTDADVQALRLGFDIEAWRVASVGNPEAAFEVILEMGQGSGFQEVKKLGTFTTGPLSAPPAGTPVDGNDPAYRQTFDSGPLELDIPLGATFRVRWIGTSAARNTLFGLDNVWLRTAAVGDANIDGVFNSTDLVQVFQAGEYEDGIAGNSTWSEGDWSGDNDFNSSDLIAAFTAGLYSQAALPKVASVPEPATVTLLLVALVGLAARRRS